MSLYEEISEEIVAALEASDESMGRAELLDLCPTAVDADDISSCLNRLYKRGRVEKMGRNRWSAVIDAVPEEPQPREPVTVPQSAKVWPRPSQAINPNNIPKLGEDDDPLIAAIRDLPTPEPFPDAVRSATVLRELANWPAMHQEVADKLIEIATEITKRAA